MKSSSSLSVPVPPVPPPELTKSGKPLNKKEKKVVCPRLLFYPCSPRTDFHSHQLREQTAGPKWFDLPAPAEAELPRLYKEYQALRLRNQLDPKRFYRKEPGEGRGIKGLPKHFAVRFQFASAVYLHAHQCLFHRLARSLQRTHHSVNQVVTIYRTRLASVRWWTNWSMTQRHDTMPNGSLTSFKHHALRKAAERLQHGKLLENPSGKQSRDGHFASHDQARVNEKVLCNLPLFFLLCCLL